MKKYPDYMMADPRSRKKAKIARMAPNPTDAQMYGKRGAMVAHQKKQLAKHGMDY